MYGVEVSEYTCEVKRGSDRAIHLSEPSQAWRWWTRDHAGVYLCGASRDLAGMQNILGMDLRTHRGRNGVADVADANALGDDGPRTAGSKLDLPGL